MLPFPAPHEGPAARNEPPVGDAVLVAALREGSLSAFDELVRRYYATLCTYATGMLGERAVAEELVQDVLFALWRGRETLQVRGELDGYLLVSVRHAVFRHTWRERYVARWSGSGVRDTTRSAREPRPDEHVAARELERAIDRAITQLPPRTREAFVLCRLNGLPQQDAARIMGVSARTVETQVGLALKALRRELAEWLG